MRKHYAFTYTSGLDTTEGEPNTLTGRRNIAGNLSKFDSKAERDHFIEQSTKHCRPVKYRHIREYFYGMTVYQMNEYIKEVRL